MHLASVDFDLLPADKKGLKMMAQHLSGSVGYRNLRKEGGPSYKSIKIRIAA